MDKSSISPGGKIFTAGHTTHVEGLKKLVDTLVEWDEISRIYIGPLSKTRGSSGGFSFRATRLYESGGAIVGIKCNARYGSSNQQIVLYGDSLAALKAKLQKNGYGGNW